MDCWLMRYNVARVSAWVRWESWREQKRGMIFFVLFCSVLFCFVFCFRSNFRAITRLETQVTHTMEWTTPGRIANTSEKEYRYTAIAKNREAEKCLSSACKFSTGHKPNVLGNATDRKLRRNCGFSRLNEYSQTVEATTYGKRKTTVLFFYRINNWRLRTA